MKCGGHGGCAMSMISKVLVIVGGLNWGLLGVGMLMGKMTEWNVVHMLLGSWPMVEAVVYVLVGLAALGKVFGCCCAKCKAACAACAAGGKEGKM